MVKEARDEGCCSINFTKYSLQIYNIVYFLLSGLTVLGVCVWTILLKFHFVPILATHTYLFLVICFTVSGIISLIGSVSGLCGVWREHRALIAFYLFVLMISFTLQAVAGGLAYFYETQVDTELKATLNSTFNEKYGVEASPTEAIDWIQQRYQCCGAIRFEDWAHSVWLRSRRKDLLVAPEGRLAPDSCCISVSERCGALSNRPSNIYYTGCIYQLGDELKEHLLVLGAVGLGICAVQIVGMIISCCLYVKLKKLVD